MEYYLLAFAALLAVAFIATQIAKDMNDDEDDDD